MNILPTTTHHHYADHHRFDCRALETGFAKTMENDGHGVRLSLEGRSDSLVRWSRSARATDYSPREGLLVLILE